MSVPNTGNNENAYPDRAIRAQTSELTHRRVASDSSTHALVGIGTVHHHEHEGEAYFFQEGFSLNNAAREYLIETADSLKEPHMVIHVTGSQDTRIEFIKRTDHTPGDELEIQPRNERIYFKPITRIWRDPGGADGGEAKKMWSAQFGVAAAGGGRGAAAGSFTTRSEIILARRSAQNIGKYLLRVTALSQNDNNITVGFDFYEHTPKD